MHNQRKNLLDIYPVGSGHVGIFRDPFEKVMELEGFELTPTENASEIWEFSHPDSGIRGRLLNVEGFLGDEPVSLTTRGRAYMITRQNFTLALLFPGSPRRLKLSESRFKVVAKDSDPGAVLAAWPAAAIDKVIRHRFRNIVILEEAFLLQQIGLRGKI